MNIVRLEDALTIAQEDLGISTSYNIAEQDRLVLNDIEENIQQGDKEAMLKRGDFFDTYLREAIQQYFCEQRERVVGNDSLYLTSVPFSEEFHGVCLSSHYQLFMYRYKQFKGFFSEFDIDSLEKGFELTEHRGKKSAFSNMGRIFDQAGDLKALRAVIFYATQKEFSTAYKGLLKTLILDYETIMDALRNDFETEKLLVPVIPPYFQPRIARVLPLVQTDKQVVEYTDHVQSLAEFVIEHNDLFRSDIVDFANNTYEILISKKWMTDILTPDERKKTIEFLLRLNGFINRLKDRSYREIVLEPSEKI
jgi:hypothetical protein